MLLCYQIKADVDWTALSQSIVGKKQYFRKIRNDDVTLPGMGGGKGGPGGIGGGPGIVGAIWLLNELLLERGWESTIDVADVLRWPVVGTGGGWNIQMGGL